MKTKFVRMAAASAALLILTLPVQANVVPGELLGVYEGNDTSAGLLDNLGIAATFLARVDTPSSIETTSLTNDGLTISDFTLNSENEAIGGSWTYTGPEIANLLVVKSDGFYAVYLFTNAITGNMPNIGLWSTEEIKDKGLSHITAYSVVIPVPAAIWLMATALFGLGFVRRKTV